MVTNGIRYHGYMLQDPPDEDFVLPVLLDLDRGSAELSSFSLPEKGEGI